MWKWIKKNWVAVLAGTSALIGFITGYRLAGDSVRGADELIGQLREELKQSRALTDRLREDSDQLESLTKNQRARIERIEGELAESGKFIEAAARDVNAGRASAGDLRSGLDGLRKLVEKHREELEAIQVHD